ncbi:MAG: CBS domain-containing protein [Deltaproteobacteria bacterium]|nr:CBS domain-containing protein [Deltaproteobacteria bacterium]
MTQQIISTTTEQSFHLSELLGRKVLWNGKKIGKLDDIVIRETEAVPEVTDIIVSRSFGHKSLLVPWVDVEIDEREVVVRMESIESREKDRFDGLVLLNDHIIDKKIVDLEDHEVEVVYDVRLRQRGGKLYVSDVDCSRQSFLRRIGLKCIANFISDLAATLKDEPISWKYVQPLSPELGRFTGSLKLNILKEKLHEIHPVDLADILEEMDHDHRLSIFNELNVEKASDTLEEIEPRVQREIIHSIGEEKAAELIEEMTPAQAADVLSVLPASDADNILALMDEKENVEKIESLMDDHNKDISDFATSFVITFPPETKIEEVFQQFREVARDKDVIWYIYVLSGDNRLLGVVDYHSMLRADPSQRLDAIMITGVKKLELGDTLKDATVMFERYGFRAIPLLDAKGVLQGVVPYRDVMKLKHTYLGA